MSHFFPTRRSSDLTPEESLCWSLVSLTTVGFGDFYPVTPRGRIVEVLLMVSGVGLFGSFAAYIGSLFVADRNEEDNRDQLADRETLQRLLVQVESLTEEMRSLKLQLGADRSDEVDAVKRGVCVVRSLDKGAQSGEQTNQPEVEQQRLRRKGSN